MVLPSNASSDSELMHSNGTSAAQSELRTGRYSPGAPGLALRMHSPVDRGRRLPAKALSCCRCRRRPVLAAERVASRDCRGALSGPALERIKEMRVVRRCERITLVRHSPPCGDARRGIRSIPIGSHLHRPPLQRMVQNIEELAAELQG